MQIKVFIFRCCIIFAGRDVSPSDKKGKKWKHRLGRNVFPTGVVTERPELTTCVVAR